MSKYKKDSESLKLIKAAKGGNVLGVIAALNAGADKEAVDPGCFNYRALHWGAGNGHKDVVIKLLNIGVNVDARDDRGFSALHSAVFNGHEDVMKLLIGSGSLIDAKDNEGFTSLMAACQEGYDNLVLSLLIAGASLGSVDQDGWPAVYYASMSGHHSVLKLLASHGADIKTKNNGGFQPIYQAASNGHDLAVETLIKLGADANCAAKDGYTPLNASSANGHDKVVEILLDNKAKVDYKNNAGYTALAMASNNGHASTAHLLITHGANVDASSIDGSTPRIHESREGKDDVVKLLILYGADINRKSVSDTSPLYVASYKGNVNIAEILIQNGAQKHVANPNWQATHAAAKEGHLNVLKKLKEHGCDLNASTKDCNSTPLHLAIINAKIEVSKWLVVNGAKLHTKDRNGNTALQLAIKNKYSELASLMTDPQTEGLQSLNLNQGTSVSKTSVNSSPSATEGTSNLECVVCMDPRTSTVMTLTCRHAVTCQKCMDDMEQRGDNRCPLCRTEIDQRIPIFIN